MFEKILIPLDGSQKGEAALPYIAELIPKLAKAGKVEVTLIQVVSPLTTVVVAGEAPARIAYTEGEMEQIKKIALDYLEKMGVGLSSKGAIVNYRVGVGGIAEEIIKTADEIGADVVAMSTHGRSGLGQWAFGSVTSKVLRGGHTPVLMVRAMKDVGRI